MGRMVNDFLVKMVPDARRCREAAERLHEQYPGDTPEQLARRAIHLARKHGMAVGAVTGTAANPLVMLPAAATDMAAMLRIEGTMAGTIAALLDPVALDEEHLLRADVVGILFPGAVSQVLRQVGLRAGEQITKGLIRKSLSEELLRSILGLVGKRLGLAVTRNALVEKVIPLVGAGIGAGWNWLEAGVVGERAIHYYLGEPLGVPGESAIKRVKSIVKNTSARMRHRPSAPPRLPAPDDKLRG